MMKPSKSTNLSRRKFLGTVGAATAAFTIVPRHVMAGSGQKAPSDLINVAGIGIGAQGAGDIANAPPVWHNCKGSRALRLRPEGFPRTSRAGSLRDRRGNLPTSTPYVMWIQSMPATCLRVTPGQRFIPTGAKCSTRSLQ